jgi:hypothetical protein
MVGRIVEGGGWVDDGDGRVVKEPRWGEEEVGTPVNSRVFFDGPAIGSPG